ncbi:MAG: exodeoxyribonuclease III [Taibaiella sp.]|nr:exodeoxyribonuclease III [Taibaiella sp.]
MVKLVSWNVNGLRACVGKGFTEFFKKVDADIFCIQESKLQDGQIELPLEGYRQYWNHAVKKGYAGTAIFSRTKPLTVTCGIGTEAHDNEGRVITLEMDEYYVVTVYTPNAQRGLERLSYRMIWEDDFRSWLKFLDEKKPVIVCGDMNVAHKEIDIKNASSNKNSAGFTIEERTKFTELLEAGFIDTYRHFFPDRKGAYTWWSYMFNAREKNVGWRIDYFCISERLKDRLVSADIHAAVPGSDHCPVELVIK